MYTPSFRLKKTLFVYRQMKKFNLQKKKKSRELKITGIE